MAALSAIPSSNLIDEELSREQPDYVKQLTAKLTVDERRNLNTHIESI